MIMSLSSKNTLSIGIKRFGEAQSKAVRAYTQGGQYDMESRVHLIYFSVTHRVYTNVMAEIRSYGHIQFERKTK